MVRQRQSQEVHGPAEKKKTKHPIIRWMFREIHEEGQKVLAGSFKFGAFDSNCFFFNNLFYMIEIMSTFSQKIGEDVPYDSMCSN